jgi:hypothetical protein
VKNGPADLTITTKTNDPQDKIIQSGKWHGYTVKEPSKKAEIEELVKKADEERLKELQKMFKPLK